MGFNSGFKGLNNAAISVTYGRIKHALSNTH
jgi:hypothetical protein